MSVIVCDTEADWAVLGIDGIEGVVRKAVSTVNSKYHGLLEVEDLKQDAYIILTTKHSNTFDQLQSGNIGLGAVHHRLVLDLLDSVQTEMNHRMDRISYETFAEGWDKADSGNTRTDRTFDNLGASGFRGGSGNGGA